MSKPSTPRQTETSVEANISFFRERLHGYSAHVETLDTYRNIRVAANEALSGVNRLLDIGNGGTFDYDVSLVREIVALDLFLEDLPVNTFPENVHVKNGSALDIPEPDGSYDTVMLSMLIHHLVGKTVGESVANVSRALSEAFRVLKPGGKLVILESCVPKWFYIFERIVYPVVSRSLRFVSDHPATLQYPAAMISEFLRRHTRDVDCVAIATGRWILQFGLKYPAVLTPATPYRFVAYKR